MTAYICLDQVRLSLDMFSVISLVCIFMLCDILQANAALVAAAIVVTLDCKSMWESLFQEQLHIKIKLQTFCTQTNTRRGHRVKGGEPTSPKTLAGNSGIWLTCTPPFKSSTYASGASWGAPVAWRMTAFTVRRTRLSTILLSGARRSAGHCIIYVESRWLRRCSQGRDGVVHSYRPLSINPRRYFSPESSPNVTTWEITPLTRWRGWGSRWCSHTQ